MSKRNTATYPIAVIIADTHLSDNNHDVNVSIYKQAIDLAKRLNLNSVEHLGDLFHSRKAQTQRNLNCLGFIFRMFEENEIHLHVVVGNHDKTEYSIENSFLDTYSHHPFVHIHPTHSSRGGVAPLTSLHYLSYFSDDKYIEYIKKISPASKERNVLLTHIGVNGAVMNNGTKIETKINQSLFKPFDLILIGHYHDPQQVSEKIRYVGAALQHNFGEKPVKGATVLYSDLSVKFEQFSFPQYLSYEIDAKDITIKDVEDLRETIDNSSDRIRIVLTGSKEEIASVNKQRLLSTGVDVCIKQDVILEEDIEEALVAFTDSTLLESFEDFCKKNKLNKDKGLNYLKQILC